MKQSFGCTLNDGDEHIASVRLWQQKCGKRRCRNNHGVLILMTAIGQSQSESEDSIIMVAFKEGWIHRDHWIF